MSITYIPRVTQLDAVSLDHQVQVLFQDLILQATKFVEPKYIQPILPELELLTRTLIFKYSLCDKKCTFGQQMLSLKYIDTNFTRSKLCWYYGYTIGLEYLKVRAIHSFTSNIKVQNLVHNLQTFQLVGDIFNFIRFIQCGKYPLLIDFILGLQLGADSLTRENLNDFSWTRELLWNNFIELLGTAISLMNIFGLRSKISSALKLVWWRKHVRSGVTATNAVMTVNTTCACCSGKPILPHTMGCSHIFCYYCLMANKTADKDFACPICYYNGKQVNRFTMA